VASDRFKPDDIDLATAYSVVVGKMLTICPNATAMELVIRCPDGNATIPVPMGPRHESLEQDILDTLARYKPGQWVQSKEIALILEKDPANGSFRRTLADMANRQIIISNKNLGYQLPQEK
jgi:hypothetical protein